LRCGVNQMSQMAKSHSLHHIKKKNPYGEYDKPLRHLSLLCHIFKGAYLLQPVMFQPTIPKM
jgi:hypothetical protein